MNKAYFKQLGRETSLAKFYYLFWAVRLSCARRWLPALESFLGFLSRIDSLSLVKFIYGGLKRSYLIEKGVAEHSCIHEAPLHYSILLKPYVSERERGVIIISFEKELRRIVFNPSFSEIEKKYIIIFMPSTSGIFSIPLVALGKKAAFPFFVMPVNRSEEKFCNVISSQCLALPFNAASWVNEQLYSERRRRRDIDCLIVASFSRVKRHRKIFEALKGISQNVEVYCVGFPIGSRTAESIIKEAAEYGVQDRVNVIENPEQSTLREYFSRAKLFCGMSFREGSFIAVAEALMSGTPVVAFQNSTFGTKSLIDNNNGALVRNLGELRKAIIEFIENEAPYDKIALEAAKKVGAIRNSRRLNSILKEVSFEWGGEWKEDIESFYSLRLRNYYFNEGAFNRLSEDFERLENYRVWFNS